MRDWVEYDVGSYTRRLMKRYMIRGYEKRVEKRAEREKGVRNLGPV